MDAQKMKSLGLDDPSRQVTAGEVMQYVAAVVMGERERLARIMLEYKEYDPQDLASVIADVRDDEVLRWGK